jgi:hypothetical protein
MEHKGVQYQVVQTANPTGFKWTVYLDANRTRTGVSHTMKFAILEAQRKIDQFLKAPNPKTPGGNPRVPDVEGQA